MSFECLYRENVGSVADVSEGHRVSIFLAKYVGQVGLCVYISI
jgi:hypothetical protein